jgi:c-di-GMP-binding flagellar brake protein YcgR
MFLDAETEKRKNARADARFIVAYARLDSGKASDRDISQTRNISEGGLALTTSRPFASQTNMTLKIKLPVEAEAVEVSGTVIESKEINRNYVYFTRISFSHIDEQKRRAIQQTVEYYARKNRLHQ